MVHPDTAHRLTQHRSISSKLRRKGPTRSRSSRSRSSRRTATGQDGKCRTQDGCDHKGGNEHDRRDDQHDNLYDLCRTHPLLTLGYGMEEDMGERVAVASQVFFDTREDSRVPSDLTVGLFKPPEDVEHVPGLMAVVAEALSDKVRGGLYQDCVSKSFILQSGAMGRFEWQVAWTGYHLPCCNSPVRHIPNSGYQVLFYQTELKQASQQGISYRLDMVTTYVVDHRDTLVSTLGLVESSFCLVGPLLKNLPRARIVEIEFGIVEEEFLSNGVDHVLFVAI